jgi:Sucrase/ferredoxin-like
VRQVPVPRETLERCALQAQLRGDPMLGTAFPAARLLLVEQPGPWGPDGLRQSRFDPAVAAALEIRAGRLDVRTLVIRRFGRTPRGTPRRWALVDCRFGREEQRWGTYADDAELLDLPLDGTAGTAEHHPVYLVCAHSRHDTCCALRGRPVAAALSEQCPGRVWECGHVGGERFAANVLVVPTGLLYGRVLPFAAEEFVAAADAGEVVGALLRGRVGLAPVAQAALAFAHEQLALRRVDELRVTGLRRVPGEPDRVRLRTVHGEVEVSVAVERAAPERLTCHATRTSTALVYRPLRIVPVS